MKVEDIKKGMTVTVRPAVRGIAPFEGAVLGTAGNFVLVNRGAKNEQWAVGAHECQPYDGLTDFQRKVRAVVWAFDGISVSDAVIKVDTFKAAANAKEKSAQEASITRAARRYPLCNFIEVKRVEVEGKSVATLCLKESK